MSINQKSGRKTFRRRFVSGSVFSFRLARRNVISKRNENWNLSSLVGFRRDVIQRSDVKVHYGFAGNRLPSTTKLWVLFMKTGFSSVNYNNVYGRWIITQYLRQIKENSKLNNGGFVKYLSNENLQLLDCLFHHGFFFVLPVLVGLSFPFTTSLYKRHFADEDLSIPELSPRNKRNRRKLYLQFAEWDSSDSLNGNSCSLVIFSIR